MTQVGQQVNSLPISEFTKFKDHTKVASCFFQAISAMDLDVSGSRLATGGYDYEVRLFDFNAMDATMKPFRVLEPWDGNQVTDLHFSKTGDKLLICSASHKPKLLDRHGAYLMEYNDGDPYVYDQSKTTGHVAAINSIRWSTQDKSEFVTCSTDSTIRLWDAAISTKPKLTITVKGPQMKKTKLNCAIYSHDGKLLICSGEDGIIRMYHHNGPYHRPCKEIPKAHLIGNEISGLAINSTGNLVISRSADETLKVWDMRKLKEAVNVVSGLPMAHAETNCIYSPNEDFVLTCTSAKKEGGKMLIYDLNFNLVSEKEFPAGANKVCWHPKLNQIFVGQLDGSITTFFDPDSSQKGVLLCMDRHFKIKEKAIIDNTAEGIVLNPEDDTPLNEQYNLKKVVKGSKDTRKPELPVPPEAKMKKLTTTMTQQILQSTIKSDLRDLDPRDAVLRFAEAAEKEPFWVTPAYKRTQPKTLFDTKKYEDEPEAKRRA